jgi:uncharacterized OsmC-like protein
MTKSNIAASQTIVNGVDTQVVKSLIKSIQEDPDLAKFKFHLKNKWINKGFNRSTVKSFYGCKQENEHKQILNLEADEHASLAGDDNAANPVEHQLHALISCLTSSLIYHAAVRNIKIDELESELEGDIDVHGFLGMSDKVRRGYENIRIKFKVKTDEEDMEKLKELSMFSPVLDVSSNGTKIDLQVEKV